MGRPVSPRSLVLIAACAVPAMALAACDTPQNNFNPQSDAAVRIDNLYWLIIIAASVVGAGVLGALGYIIVKFRARPGVEAKQIHGSTPLEIVWTLIPIAVLVVIAVPTVLGIAAAAREPDDDALHVRAIGHQFWFEFQYPGLGPNGEDVVTANELYLPVHRQVSITLEGNDVIHSFWVPQLVGKTDMIPNRVNRLEPFTPMDIGTFYGQCAEYCGLGHAQMRFRVHVVSLGQFNRMIEGFTSPAPEPAAGTPLAAGQTMFQASCGFCHAIEGVSDGGAFPAPNLTLFGERETLGAGILPNTDENLRAWIRDLRQLKAVPVEPRFMPSFVNMPEDQIANMAAYLRSLRLED